MHAEFSVTALRDTMFKHGIPEIMNTDHGGQFASLKLIEVPNDYETKVSMDEKRHWRDNVFIERFWRTEKRENV
jgi:putative transposase